nr:unnamed protein product [Naegleria fowleri]
MYDFMKSMEIDILGVNKTFTDPVTNQVVMLNISESVSLSRTSSQYELTFNSSLWKDDEISLDIRISLVKPYSYSGFGYFTYDVSPVDSSSNAFYNTFQYGSAQDRFSYTSRQTFNLNFNTPQTISALGNLSDVIAINYSPDPNTPSLDGQLPLCYMQINTIFPDNVFKYSGMIYFYSTKTSKQYSANFGPSFTIDSSKKQAQYMISSEMLDCTQGATTTIYVWLEILSWDSYYDSGVITTQVSASRKTMQLIDDVNKVYSDLTFSSRYEGAVYYVKSFSSLKYPYDLTMSTTFTSLDSPFLSFLSYGVPLSWANQKPMILQSTKTPSSSTDYVAYDVDVTPGMYFTFIEKGSCNVYPCRASFKFSISQDLLSPPVLSTAPSNSLKISKSGYRANGFLTAVEIPQISTRSSQGTPNILYNLKVLASVQVDTQPSSFTITNPLTLQVTKQLQDATQNLPFNSTYSQQIASQNYITSYKCTNTFETHYLVVNTVIQNVNDYGKWYITFYSHPEVSYKVTFTVHLMNNVFSVTQTTNGAKLPILYSPISSVLYGLQLNSQSSFGQTNFMISLDSNTLSFSRNQQYEILFKHGSVPTDTDYDVKSPLLQNVARYPYQQFITRFIYGQNVVLSYLMDNPYYSNGNTRKNFPSSMYSSKVLSDTGNLSNGILYFLIKAIPLSDTMCISDSSLDTPSNFIFAQYQYSSTLIISEGSSKKLNSQVMSIDLSKKPSSPNSEIIADFYQETLSTIFEPSASILFYNSKTKSVQSNSDDSYTNDTASSVQIAFHNLTYLPNGPEFKTPYYSFKYTIRMKIDNTGDSSNQNSQIFLLFPVSLNGFLSPLNNFDAILSMNSKFDPNMYFIDLISPTIIVGSIVGAFSALIAIGYLIATCVFLLASQKREFNLGNPNPKVWLACLCPASIPVSICYIYFFCYEARKNILPPSETKRRRRVRFLIAFSMLSFIVGVLASAYFFGRMFFIHTQAVASANSREYYLGRKDPNADKYSTPSYTPTLMPCCSTARPSTDGQSFTYFGNAHVFFKQKYGGRLDCAPPQWFMDSALGTKFLLQSIDGLPYVSPKHDPAIAATNMKNGRSHTFEMASTYCMANSVILMPADDDYNAYGIPGVLFGIGPILYSFFLMSIVIFESVMNNKMNQSNYFIVGQTTLSSLVKGENVQENTDDKTTLLINEEARNSIYAVYPSAPLHDGDDRNNNNNGMSQSSEESGFQHEEAQPYIHEQLALQQSTNQFTKEY